MPALNVHLFGYLGHGIMFGIPSQKERESILLGIVRGLGFEELTVMENTPIVDEVSIDRKAFTAIFDCQMGVVLHIVWKMTQFPYIWMG